MAWTDVTMVVLTGASAGAAFWAVVVARSSRAQAGTAVLTAKDANQIARESNRLASESNQIARDAARDARAAAIEVAWDELLAAVAAIQTLDPAQSAEPVRPFLTAIRTRATLLVDRLEWAGFDGWIAAEIRLGVMLMHEAAEKGHKSAPLTASEALQIDGHFHVWVAAFMNNLRMFRKTGPQVGPLTQLTEVARTHIRTTAARNGWPEPTDRIPGLASLKENL